MLSLVRRDILGAGAAMLQASLRKVLNGRSLVGSALARLDFAACLKMHGMAQAVLPNSQRQIGYHHQQLVSDSNTRLKSKHPSVTRHLVE